jgi:heat shock protein HtpX
MKRILLFALTNIAVLVVVSIVARMLGLDAVLAANGANWASVLVFCALFGFGGAVISLLISKWSAKRMMNVRVITEPANPTEQWLVSTVRAQAEQARIGMPEVGIFESPDPNAFATGANKNAALVAVSTGLLQRMNRQEVEAVLGHEVGHVANGDMVTLTLIQGVVNTFVLFLSRVVGTIVDRAVFRNENGPGAGYFITVLVSQIVFGIAASAIVAWFSRQREFRADEAGARLAGTGSMIGALEALKRSHDPQPLPEKMAAFGINAGVPSGFKKLFMSHPPLDERIAALRNARIG